jgi:hypothetical protein
VRDAVREAQQAMLVAVLDDEVRPGSGCVSGIVRVRAP